MLVIREKRGPLRTRAEKHGVAHPFASFKRDLKPRLSPRASALIEAISSQTERPRKYCRFWIVKESMEALAGGMFAASS